jgi:hypothetical protein
MPHQPIVVMPASSYPNAVSVGGVDIALDPMKPDPQKQDDWYHAGICPTKIIINNSSPGPVVIDPSQITCTDVGGVTYKPFNAKEAGDIVIASEAFKSYAKGAVAGAVFGAALGALTGAALGNLLGGSSLAARGAVYGAAKWGTEGAVVGGVSNRVALEKRTRGIMEDSVLQQKVLARFMKHEGYVFFPAVQIASVELLVTDPTYANVSKVNIPINVFAQKTDKPALAPTTSIIPSHAPSPIKYDEAGGILKYDFAQAPIGRQSSAPPTTGEAGLPKSSGHQPVE